MKSTASRSPFDGSFRLAAVGTRPIATLILGVAALWFVVEWLLFGLIAGQIGWFPTIVLSIVKGGAGLVLLGYVLRRMQLGLRDLSKGNARFSLGEPLLAIFGAILICLPGFVATLIGLGLFAPSIRGHVLQRFRTKTGDRAIDLEAGDYREIK